MSTTAARQPGEFSPALLAPRYWPTWCAVGLLTLLQGVPRGARDRVAGWIGALQYRTNTKRRETVELNLSRCYPQHSGAVRRRWAQEHFRTYAQVIADYGAAWWDWGRRRAARRCSVRGHEHLEAAQRAGRSVILLTPHTVAVYFGGLALDPYVAQVTSVANRFPDPVVQWLFERMNKRHGARVWTREDGLRPVVRALRREGTVFYYMPDEDRGQRDSVFAPFFGQQKATLNTLGRLARLSGAVVIPMMSWYAPEDGHYHVDLGAPLEDFPNGDAVREATMMNRAIEHRIALRPEQYLWNFRLFRTRPDGTRMEYPRSRRRRGRRKSRRKSG